MSNEKYPEVQSYKIIKSMMDQNKDKEREIELRVREYELEIETLQREVDSKRMIKEDYDIFSPRSEKKRIEDSNEERQKITILRKEKEQMKHELEEIKKTNRNLNYVLENISVKKNVERSEELIPDLRKQIEFCISVIDMDPQRVKTELERILQIVPRETFE